MGECEDKRVFGSRAYRIVLIAMISLAACNNTDFWE